MGLIERYGTGIKRVKQLFIDHGLPEPEFKLVQEGFFVRVFASAHIDDVAVNEGLKSVLLAITPSAGCQNVITLWNNGGPFWNYVIPVCLFVHTLFKIGDTCLYSVFPVLDLVFTICKKGDVYLLSAGS